MLTFLTDVGFLLEDILLKRFTEGISRAWPPGSKGRLHISVPVDGGELDVSFRPVHPFVGALFGCISNDWSEHGQLNSLYILGCVF